jgi:signal peptidase I
VQDDVDGSPQYMTLVKRLIGVPGDHIHLSNGVVVINGVAQNLPPDADNSPYIPQSREYLDEFPSIPPAKDPSGNATDAWGIDFPNHEENGELVVPPGKYFMMGDHRHNSLDSRYWGFAPRENIIGRPLFNYWSFEATEDQLSQTGAGSTLAWLGHVVLHFFPDTRWSRTLHRVK